MVQQDQPGSVCLSATATIPELQQSKTAVLNTLASGHSRRSYEYAIERFIAWYCSEPRLTFNRSVVVKYRSFLERLSLSAATINLHLSAIRRLADESAESGWLSPELAIGIRRVKGVKRLGRKMGNWLTRNQAQELVNAASKTNLRGWRDGAMVGLLLGCGLRRSEVVGLNLAYGKKTHLRFRGRGVYPTEGSCRFPLIVLQQTTQSFLATHNSVIPARPSIRQWKQQPVLLALVIALLVVMAYGKKTHLGCKEGKFTRPKAHAASRS